MRRCAALLLAAMLVLGSLMMWLGLPAGCLWLFSHTGRNYFEVYVETLVCLPPLMAGWGWCLHRINRAYCQIATTWQPAPTGLLEACMIGSVILALAALITFVILGWGPGHLSAQGAW